MICRSQPGRDRRQFPVNGWLTLNAVIQKPPVIGSLAPKEAAQKRTVFSQLSDGY